MGVIYQAHDPVIDRRVAIKLIRADLLEGGEQQDFIERFRREAQAAGRCVHPNIVAIFDFATHEGNPFLAMELVNGISLATALRERGRFAPPAAVAIMLQVLDALDSAHRIGVVHRDIKPANILLARGGVVKITDFGIARLETSELTHHGSMIGTPSYMSPEQCRGETVDARSDLFSAGAVLFEMLAGARPFPGRSQAEIAHRLLHDEPGDLAAVVPGLPPGVAAAVQHALAKRAQDRFPSAQAMASALRAPAAVDASAWPAALRAPAGDGTVVARRTGVMVGPIEAQKAERALAQYVGPIAKVLVKRALARATSPAALWEALAAEIERDADRAAFLRQRPAPGTLRGL
jgi:serine/threonine-protein kinase